MAMYTDNTFNRRGLIDMATQIYSKEGIKSFYSGLGIGILVKLHKFIRGCIHISWYSFLWIYGHQRRAYYERLTITN